MDCYLSRKIAFFHVIGVFVVLYLHVFLPNIEASAFNDVQSFWSQVFCRVFHPMYFSLAGYLFFFSIKEGKLAEFVKKLKSRLHSLVMPYLICNIIGGLFIIWISGYDMASLNVQMSVNYYNSHNPLLFFFYRPALGQLWFVRDLIFLACFSYPLYFLLKTGRLWALGGLLLLVILTKGHVFNTGLLLSLFSYSVGAYLAIFKVNVKQVPYAKAVYVLAVAYLIVFWFFNGKVEYYIQSLCVWSLFLACWNLYDTCPRVLDKLTNWGGVQLLRLYIP